MEMFNPSHPGRIVREFLSEKITVSFLAKHLRMTRANLSMILNGRLGISASVALKLGEAFPNQDAHFWLALQSQYDLAKARKKKRTKIAPLFKKTAFKKAA